jgi:hypothetical protein
VERAQLSALASQKVGPAKQRPTDGHDSLAAQPCGVTPQLPSLARPHQPSERHSWELSQPSSDGTHTTPLKPQ